MGWIRGTSPAWTAFERSLEQVARSEAGVLVQGEHGSGKSSAAREIHRLSARSGEPLVEVQLSLLPATLIESELFGHAAGAFTGARGERAGRFERAGAGTVVLDGVETLAENLQSKLLRVLQEREIEPLGSEKSLPLRARVVATAALDLRRLVQEGRFREDLYFRLAVITLELPPLRARAEDLLALASALVAQAAERLRLPARSLSPAALEHLARQPWPGNLRQLENALERVLVLAPAAPGAPAGPVQPEEFAFLEEGRADELAASVREFLARGLELPAFENALLSEVLAQCRGNVSAAARALGLSRRAFEHRRAKPEGARGAEEG